MVSLQPVDPAEWLGALTKCDGRALPCLKVGMTSQPVISRCRQTGMSEQREPPGSEHQGGRDEMEKLARQGMQWAPSP